MYLDKWNKQEVHARLAAEIETPEFLTAYQKIRIQFPALLWLVKPESLNARLHAEGCGYEEKDHILHALIAASQCVPELRQCSFTLLSLALWPALEHSYYKLLQASACLPDLWAEIHGDFLDAVMRFNLAKTDRIAINLQMNVEKAVKQSIKREAQSQGMEQAYFFLDTDISSILDDPYRNRSARIKELIAGIPEKSLKRCLRRFKNNKPPSLGDADREIMTDALLGLEAQGLISADERRLISSHVLDGIALGEIARVMGIRSGALRGRYFRIKTKLQKHFNSQKGA